MKITSLQEAKQAAFNGSVKGLSYQGWVRCTTPTPGNDGCVWNRGKPGFHCAVGWLIPWKDQSDEMSGSSLSAIGVFPRESKLAPPLRRWVEERRNLGSPKSEGYLSLEEGTANKEFGEFSAFLLECQQIHDAAPAVPGSLKAGFLQLADRHNLSWPKSVSK